MGLIRRVLSFLGLLLMSSLVVVGPSYACLTSIDASLPSAETDTLPDRTTGRGSTKKMIFLGWIVLAGAGIPPALSRIAPFTTL
jgi:hypothetical protein